MVLRKRWQCTLFQNEPQGGPGDIFRLNSLGYWTENQWTHLFLRFVDDFGGSQNHEYLSVCNFERRKSHLRFEICRLSAFNSQCFLVEIARNLIRAFNSQTSRAFSEISVPGGLTVLLKNQPTPFYRSPQPHVLGLGCLKKHFSPRV